jgi:hypothetical protein
VSTTINIDIVDRLDDLRAELARIPDITREQVRALVASFTRELRARDTVPTTRAPLPTSSLVTIALDGYER